MRILVVGDTHDYPDGKTAERELGLISKTAIAENCSSIIHCGDLENDHFGHSALGNLPIYVLRTRMNEKLDTSISLPENWHVLDDKPQMLIFGKTKKLRLYLDHYLGVKILSADMSIPTPEAMMFEEASKINHAFGLKALRSHLKFIKRILKKGLGAKLPLHEIIGKIQKDFGEIHYILCGHSHNQFHFSALNTLIVNPGAFGMGLNGYKRSYEVIDSKTWKVTGGVTFA